MVVWSSTVGVKVSNFIERDVNLYFCQSLFRKAVPTYMWLEVLSMLPQPKIGNMIVREDSTCPTSRGQNPVAWGCSCIVETGLW